MKPSFGTFTSPSGLEATWSSVPVARIPGLIADYRIRLGRASSNAAFRSYTDDVVQGLPEEAAGAKTLIACALPARHAVARLRLDGRELRVPFPSGYWDDGIRSVEIEPHLRAVALHEPGSRLWPVSGTLPNKLLAAKCGLVRYGRNCVTYAPGLGSSIAIRVFATDEELPEGPWIEPRFLAECETCRACAAACPAGAIGKADFMIDAGLCLTLYNEVEGDFPPGLPVEAHNALMGCVRCQYACPANRLAPLPFALEPLEEAESAALIAGDSGSPLCPSISAKLRLGSPDAAADSMGIYSRNLKAWIKARDIRASRA